MGEGSTSYTFVFERLKISIYLALYAIIRQKASLNIRTLPKL